MKNKKIPEIEPYSLIEAVYNPVRIDNLRPEWKPLVGQTFTWFFLWTQEHDEQYPGQRTFEIYQQPERGLPHHWSPECDLSFIRKMK